MRDLLKTTAIDAVGAMREGALTSAALVEACLERIAERDGDLRAWAFVDPDLALSQARSRDAETPRGPLHGIPIGIKDIIETVDMPTAYGSPVYAGHRPGTDAAVVDLLRQAGAVILGKTHTVEFAGVGRTPPTRNPHDFERTPGGSSSGSAAAVADLMVPMALGTQTGGSVIRPASFCGVCGFKPTFGTVPIRGVRPYAPSLDTVGFFARHVSDLAVLGHVLGSLPDEPLPRVGLDALRIGLLRTTLWEAATLETRQSVERAAARLSEAGAIVGEVELPEFESLIEAQDTLMHGEGRSALASEFRRFGRELHPDILDEVQNSRGITSEKMRWAYDLVGTMRPRVDQALSNWDAWLTPAVLGAAPRGLSSTGEATFNRPWTALHTPAVTVPVPREVTALPVGVQLVARRYEDVRLLATAWALERVLSRGAHGKLGGIQNIEGLGRQPGKTQQGAI